MPTSQENLGSSELANRLVILLNHFIDTSHQTSSFTEKTENGYIINGNFDRWRFIRENDKPVFLVSLYHFNQFLYITRYEYPCPVISELKGRARWYDVLVELVNMEPETLHEEIKKETAREKRLSRLQGFVDAAKRGDYSGGFAGPVGKTRKRSRR